MKYKIAGYTILSLIAFAHLHSCTPLPCQDETMATVKATFYETGTGKILIADSVTLFGLGMEDNPVYNKAENLQTINIPLYANTDTCSYYIKINTLTDTVTFVYSSYTHLVSKECGYTFFHILDTVYHGKNVLDYIIRSRNVTTTYEENLRIFY